MYRLHHWQPRNWAEVQQFLGDDDGDGGGNGGGGKVRAGDVLTQFSGDAVRMADKLADVLNDNSTLREQRRTLREEVTGLKAKQVPDGARVLTAEEATAYDAYTALGKPADLSKRLADADTATQRLTTLERDAVIRDAATAHGLDFDGLRAHTADLPLTRYEAQQEGKAVPRYRIGQGQEQADLGEWIGKQPAFVQRAVQAAQGNGQGGTGQGLSLPRQQFGGGQPPRNLVDDLIAQRNEAAAKVPDPLAAVAS